MGFLALQAAISGSRSGAPRVSISPASLSATTAGASKTTGACTAGVQFGQGPFSYQWTQESGGAFTIDGQGNNSTTFTASGLSAAGETRTGVFRCTVTDALNRTASSIVSVSVQRYASLSASVSPTGRTATGNTSTQTTGSSTCTPSGGSGSFNYSWNLVTGSGIVAVSPSSASTQFRGSDMLAGESRTATFQCTVTDTVTGATAVTGTVSVTVTRYANLSASVSPASVSGSSTGSTIDSNASTCSASGGSGNFSYSWAKTTGGSIVAVSASNAATTFRATGMSASEVRTATFRCTVTDLETGATASDTVSITLTNTVSATITASVSPGSLSVSGTTSTLTTASASCSVSGGSGNFSYSWSKANGDAITAVSGTSASSSFRGTSMLNGETRTATFKCTVTDLDTGATSSSNVTITITNTVSMSVSVSPASVSGSSTGASINSSSATATPSNGNGSYSYSWSKVSGGSITANTPGGATTTFNASGMLNGETRTGTFRCTVTDNATGQTASDTVSITITNTVAFTASASPSSVSGSGTTSSHETNTTTATPSGGNGSYSYSWAKTSGGSISPVSPSAAATPFTASGLAAGETRTATFKCTITDLATGRTAKTADVTATISNTASASITYSPTAGTYSRTDNGTGGIGANLTVTASQSVKWTWSASDTTGLSSTVASGNSASSIKFTLAQGTANRSTTITLTAADGSSWTINLSATGTGNVNTCPTVDTPILLAASGASKPAGDLVVGEYVYTQHETTMEWGLFPVSALFINPDQDVLAIELDGKRLRATPEHRVFVGGEWKTIADLGGVPDGRADVVKITVEDAHTYVSNGILSHNVKQ